MEFSNFGNKFRDGGGIAELMRDLASSQMPDGAPLIELGGGNPAQIRAMTDAYAAMLQAYANDHAQIAQSSGRYAPPQGDAAFIKSLVKLLNKQYDWGISEENVVLTNGSQNAFFMLFNLLAGESESGLKKILLPMAPEYIGYEDVVVAESAFVSKRPLIELVGDQEFKYRLDTQNLEVGDDINAICVSRPTNPTGNVLDDNEIAALDKLALEHDIPLIIDNAYGAPFPNIINVPATLHWHENIILSLSLSKLGLPGTRTGIVIARPQIIQALTQMNAVMNLCPTALCPRIVQPMFEDSSVLNLCEQHIQPFYQQRSIDAMQWFKTAFANLPARAHTVEGAIFLWLWFPELSISSNELYQNLKKRGVITVPGHYFFPGLNDEWPHKQQCIRVNIGGDASAIKQGLRIIAEEIGSMQGLPEPG